MLRRMFSCFVFGQRKGGGHETQKLIGAGAAIALVFSACGYELGRYQAEKANANSIAYIDASKPSKVHKNNYHQKKSR
ncbi:hypothetical protein ABG808_04150 [Streptococcus iniae]